jgi:hypothetical protein
LQILEIRTKFSKTLKDSSKLLKFLDLGGSSKEIYSNFSKLDL